MSLWFDDLEGLLQDEAAGIGTTKLLNGDAIAALRQRAEKMVKNRKGNTSISKSGNEKLMRELISKGTKADKVMALAMSIREDPLENLDKIERFTALMKTKSPREFVTLLPTYVETMKDMLLPSDRGLVYFENHEFHQGIPSLVLTMWLLEDTVKKQYALFVSTLEGMSKNGLEAVRKAVVDSCYELLVAKPENDMKLLKILVNKLGDRSNKIASHISFLLQKLLKRHPMMKKYVVDEIKRVIFQHIPSGSEVNANTDTTLIHYCMVFLSQIIFDASADQQIARDLMGVYINVFRVLLTLLKDEKIEENYMDKILSLILSGMSRALPFAKMEYTKFGAELDAIFKLVHTGSSNVSIQALVFLHQLFGPNPFLPAYARFQNALYTKLLSLDVYQTSKHAMLINILYRSMKADCGSNMDRLSAMIKRMLQNSLHHRANVACGYLLCYSEIVGQIKAAKPKQTKFDDAGEARVDYDMHKRNPEFAGAQGEPLWELGLLLNHTHPSVVRFTEQVVSGRKINYNGDPLDDLSFNAFIEKFAYKKHKKVSTEGQATKTQFHTHERAKTRSLAPPVNTEEFLKQKSIGEEDEFFTEYFKEKIRQTNIAKKKQKEKERLRERKRAKRGVKEDLLRIDGLDEDEMGGFDDFEQDDEEAQEESVFAAAEEYERVIADTTEDVDADTRSNYYRGKKRKKRRN